MTDSCEMMAPIATLKEQSKTHGKNVEKLFLSNESRKNDITKLEFSHQEVLHAVGDVAEAMKNLQASVEKDSEERKAQSLTQQRELHSLNVKVDNLEVRFEHLESKSFNWSKFMRGCISPRGMVLIIALLLSSTTIALAILAPETLPAFFEAVPKAKGS